ncbi:hypothetical protein C8D89_12017 [Actinomycetospora cinnamomea]|uniref:Uncharacterized protein n=1 Tax=Actinomycetospora cinnamomea TaxID=663609 RepID=A0A2U1EUS2_9PSEU|nr:hypothetical protein C8D89_12017 [Actinomycetospora cinnamomea]
MFGVVFGEVLGAVSGAVGREASSRSGRRGDAGGRWARDDVSAVPAAAPWVAAVPVVVEDVVFLAARRSDDRVVARADGPESTCSCTARQRSRARRAARLSSAVCRCWSARSSALRARATSPRSRAADA